MSLVVDNTAVVPNGTLPGRPPGLDVAVCGTGNTVDVPWCPPANDPQIAICPSPNDPVVPWCPPANDPQIVICPSPNDPVVPWCPPANAPGGGGWCGTPPGKPPIHDEVPWCPPGLNPDGVWCGTGNTIDVPWPGTEYTLNWFNLLGG